MKQTRSLSAPLIPSSRPDWLVLLIVCILLLVGVVFVFNASVAEAYYQFGDKYHFARNQAKWAFLGTITLLITARLPLPWIQKAARPFFILSLLLLVAVLIPGIGSKIQGARRWLQFGAFTLQPSELIKLAVVLYYPLWLEKKPSTKLFIVLTGLIMLLLMLEPDLGTALIIGIVALTLFIISGASLRHIFSITVLGVLSVVSLILVSPYRRARLMTFFDPQVDPLGSSYHLRQILISLGSGGIFGTGFGRSRQKYQYLPEATTDSIFAVIAEETGFFGALVLILLFAWFIFRSYRIIQQVNQPYARLIAVGAVAWISAQTITNLAAMVSLIPLTGIPLPYISYGGSSLITIMAATGLLLNVSRFRTIRSP